MSLRPADDRDEGLLRLIYAESRRSELDQVPWPPGTREEFLRMQYDAQVHHYQQNYEGAVLSIVERSCEPVGRLWVHRTPGEIRVMDISLLPDARGQGIGTKLFRDLFDEGTSSGKAVTVHVERFNPAYRLYQRLGFELVEDQGVYLFLRWTPVHRLAAGTA